MKNRFLYLTLILLSIMSFSLAILFNIRSFNLNFDSLFNPIWEMGQLLRNLSLGGDFQNVIAIIIFIILGISPILISLCFSIRRRKFRLEDLLALPISLILFFLLYFSINPTLLSEKFLIYNNSWFSIFVLSGILFSLIMGMIFIKLLKCLDENEINLLKILKYSFMMFAYFLVVIVFFTGAYQLFANLNFLVSGQGIEKSDFHIKNIILIFKYLVESAPLIIGVIISILAINLIEEIKTNKFSRKISDITKRIVSFSKVAVFTIIFSSVFTNILLITYRELFADMRVMYRVPFGFILIMLAMILFGKYSEESSDIKEDLDRFV